MSEVRLLGIGTALPPGSLSQAEAAEVAVTLGAGRPRAVAELYRRSRVERRHAVIFGDPSAGEDAQERMRSYYPPPSVEPLADSADGNGHPPTHAATDDRGPTTAPRLRAYARHATHLAADAARSALAAAGIQGSDVTQLVVASCTGFSAPGVDIRLITALGLSPMVGRTTIGFMGCHGAINALRIARALAAAEPGDTVLMVAVELCALHFQYGDDAQQTVANALFADGAGAVMLRRETGEGDTEAEAAARGVAHIAACGSTLLPDSAGDMTWIIGDHGFEMTLSPRVPERIEAHLRPWLTMWLGERGLAVADVAHWVIHPGGPRVIDTVERALSLPAGAGDASRAVLRECGNMSSPTVLFILERVLRESGGHLRGPCVMLAFGPGLVAEAALLGV